MKTITVTDGVYDIVQKFSESNTIKELADDSENSVIYAACYLITIAKKYLDDKEAEIEAVKHETGQLKWKIKGADMKYRKLMEADND